MDKKSKEYQIIYRLVNNALKTLTKNRATRNSKAHLYTLDFLNNPNNAFSIIKEDFDYFNERLKRECISTYSMFFKKDFCKKSSLLTRDEIEKYKKEIYKFLCLIEESKTICVDDFLYKIKGTSIKEFFEKKRESKRKNDKI